MKKDESSFLKKIFNKEEKVRTYEIKNFKRYLSKKSKYKLIINPRIKKIKAYKGYKIFSVDGKVIRDHIDFDFVMGGNGARYLYVPMDEIWVEDKYSKSKELKEIILHEYTEVSLMKHGMNYSKAHDIASIKELRLRTE